MTNKASDIYMQSQSGMNFMCGRKRVSINSMCGRSFKIIDNGVETFVIQATPEDLKPFYFRKHGEVKVQFIDGRN
jgi:hypothetical protein